MNKIIVVIPARFASTRFPAKVLALLDGKTIIEHVFRQAKKAKLIDEVIIACDHPQVFDTAIGFGAKVVMTDVNHFSGSDRIAQAVKGLEAEVVINVQGDEPFINPQVIDQLADLFKQGLPYSMATVIKHTQSHEELTNPNVVKVVVNEAFEALYFSRSCIPYNRGHQPPVDLKYYKHLGIYAYRKDFLLQYTQWPKGILEQTEQLEQLRVLERGFKIKTVVTDEESIAIDTPEDLIRASEFLKTAKGK